MLRNKCARVNVMYNGLKIALLAKNVFYLFEYCAVQHALLIRARVVHVSWSVYSTNRV